jgi:hypothetical protein
MIHLNHLKRAPLVLTAWLAAGIGFYVMPINFGIQVSGLVDEEGEDKFTAPLPAFNLRMDIALTPKWFIRTGAQVFYLKYEDFSGSILELRTALEYNPWKHVGIGVVSTPSVSDWRPTARIIPKSTSGATSNSTIPDRSSICGCSTEGGKDVRLS